MTKKAELWTGDRGTDNATRFGEVFETDELFHPQTAITDDSLTETWAYLWYIPEERISCQIHIWVHPNLNIVTAGLGVWQGHKNSMISAELFDLPAFVSATGLGDGRNMKFSNGLHVEIVEPFKEIHIHYEDKARGNALELVVTDFSPPIMRGSRNHFDQATKNQGKLKLRGKDYEINCYGMRDRSWGEPRTEALVPAPPFTWMTGTFPEAKMSWNVAAFDDPNKNPDWAGLFDVKPEEVIHDAWLYINGEMSRPRSVSKITRRDPMTLRPTTHEINIEDQQGREYFIEGTVIASIPWVGWPNMSCYVCCTEWRLNGEIGYGDTQEVQWCDYVHAMRGDQDPTPEHLKKGV